MMEELEAEFLWEDISRILTNEQTELLRMRVDGYTTREIAASKKCGCTDIEGIVAGIQESLMGLCLK